MGYLIINTDNLSCRYCDKIHPYLTKNCIPMEINDVELDNCWVMVDKVVKLSGMDATLTVRMRDEQHTLRADRARREGNARPEGRRTTYPLPSECSL